MKASLVTTILNEEDSIDAFLESIEKKTMAPGEIILVDAGSQDKTIEKIKQWQKKLPIRLIIKPGLNRSQGRNLAIKRAKNKIVAVSDAGCILDPNWLKEITKPLKKKTISVVAGNYQPVANTNFQKCLAFYTCVDIYQKIKIGFYLHQGHCLLKKLFGKGLGVTQKI